MRNDLRTFTGILLGWTDEQPNGTVVAYDKSGKKLGEYRPSLNSTYDHAGRIVYKGNALSALIVNS